ncbi:hypothetical protein S7711_07010 [Stachybotrys chartarum IBT 7711]|uniref:Tethering factor for nuclear proteasome STS1 n=1 Tax=Stachybotrys chartarum (strain CBS 109288 / IBT 7711) TaxID=1280523 RepID=A0A084AYD5_STACB|nr:hypothetical protein S7711_07010 [Stachybotrys chartarum IBT 7711]
MTGRKRKADEDGDETMSPNSSPAISTRPLARASKKPRSNEIIGRPLTLPRLLETLDAQQLRSVLERICERHPDLGHEVVAGAPRPSVTSALDVLREYQTKFKSAIPYGNSSPEYTYYRIKESLVALLDALADFTPQFLPPAETQPTKSFQFLDAATNLIHDLPDWEPQAYRYHKENAYEDISKAWALVVNEAAKRGGGFNLHTGGWDQKLSQHNQRSGGRLASAMASMANSVGWMGANQSSNPADQNSILSQLMSGNYGAPVRVGPWSGDQHTAWANPFQEGNSVTTNWTGEEIAAIASKLDKQLGPEFISSRAGPGGSRVHYLTAEKCIALANDVFGFNGWSSSIQNIQVDFADENPQSSRVSIGLSVIVRVTLRNGTYHEDIGYGSIENAKNKAMAFEKAKKEGTTDGLKRALRSFGNILGNCIYDQDYVKQVTKLKVQPTKFNPENLHRHADFVVKKEVAKEPPVSKPDISMALKLEAEDSFDDFFGELDAADFCVPGEGHPDEVVLPSNASHPPQAVQSAAQPGRISAGSVDIRPPQTPGQGQRRPTPPNGFQPAQANRAAPVPQPRAASNNAVPQPQAPPVPQSAPGLESVGFFSAKAVNQLPASSIQGSNPTPLAVPRANQIFNPKAESPSIRKTPGIDHTSSKPLARNGQHVPPTASQSSAAATGSHGNGFTPVRPSMGAGNQGPRGNMVNPTLDQARRIGVPGGPSSPLANRNSYRPPTMKRPLPGEATGQPRTALADLPVNEKSGTDGGLDTATSIDAKRQKVT